MGWRSLRPHLSIIARIGQRVGNMSISEQLFEHADMCLRTSLYCVGKFLQAGGFEQMSVKDTIAMDEMKQECRLYESFGHRKSAKYHWGPFEDDGGSDGLTRWLYDHFLKYLRINPCKGLNGDAYRAYFIWLYLTNNWQGTLRVMFGFILRGLMVSMISMSVVSFILSLCSANPSLWFLWTWLGVWILFMPFPSLMEFAIWKPQTFVLLFKVKFPYKIHWLWAPLGWVCELFFIISMARELHYVPIIDGTTNKISLLPTMKCLGWNLPHDDYIKTVYETYFGKENAQGYFISESIYKGLRKR